MAVRPDGCSRALPSIISLRHNFEKKKEKIPCADGRQADTSRAAFTLGELFMVHFPTEPTALDALERAEAALSAVNDIVHQKDPVRLDRNTERQVLVEREEKEAARNEVIWTRVYAHLALACMVCVIVLAVSTGSVVTKALNRPALSTTSAVNKAFDRPPPQLQPLEKSIEEATLRPLLPSPPPSPSPLPPLSRRPPPPSPSSLSPPPSSSPPPPPPPASVSSMVSSSLPAVMPRNSQQSRSAMPLPIPPKQQNPPKMGHPSAPLKVSTRRPRDHPGHKRPSSSKLQKSVQPRQPMGNNQASKSAVPAGPRPPSVISTAATRWIQHPSKWTSATATQSHQHQQPRPAVHLPTQTPTDTYTKRLGKRTTMRIKGATGKIPGAGILPHHH